MKLKFFGLREPFILILIIVFGFGLSDGITKNTTHEQGAYLQRDKACGPRCISALIQILKKGDTDWTIEHIYQLIGKEPFAVTTLKELKVAAEKLGFSAAGYKLTLNELKDINTYAVLPVGHEEGTATDPLHFILLKEAKGNFATIVNTENLKLRDIALSDLQKIWKGYALVLSPSKDVPLFHKHNNNPEPESQQVQKNLDGFKDFKIVESGSKLEHTFTIRNETNQKCKLRVVSKSCSCLSPEFAKVGLEPSEETSVKLTLQVDKPGWSIVTIAIALEPTEIIKRYMIRAYGKDSFEITPAIGYIEAPRGGVVQYPVKIVYHTDSNDPVTFDHIQSDTLNLTAGNIVSEQVKKGQYSAFYFDVPLLYNAGESTDAVRQVQGEVNFVLNTHNGKRFIPLKLTTMVGTEMFRLTPEKIFIIASKFAEPIQKKAKVEFLMDTLPTSIDIKPDDALPLEIKTTRVSKDTYMISISAPREKLQNISLGMNKGEITIVPEGVPSPTAITLPISLFVRE
ncbi:MAG: cysteine peptidase family C39 domain-containing protein [Planctomycetota bacterium]|jgi:predicted double-glycine peptidase